MWRAIRRAPARRRHVRQHKHANDHEEERNKNVRHETNPGRNLREKPEMLSRRGRSDIWWQPYGNC